MCALKLSSTSQKYYFASHNVLHPFPEKESISYFVLSFMSQHWEKPLGNQCIYL